MLPALVSLKSLIKTKSYHIDLPFFRLHYQVTVCLLLAFCLMLTAKVLFGDTIDCQSHTRGRDGFYDNSCYATGTFTRYIKDAPQQNITWEVPMTTTTMATTSRVDVPFRSHPEARYIHTGILLHTSLGDGQDAPKGKIQVYWHNYYQYIPIVLFIQAIFFYFPHYLWKVWENGMISSVCKRLYDNRFTPNEYFDSNYDIIYYIQNMFKLNKSLVYKYYFCHILCMANLIGQIIALNFVFNHQFITYGYLVVKNWYGDTDIYGLRHALLGKADELQDQNLNNPMDFVFPKVTSCYFKAGSEAGKEPDEADFMCVLPLNILHDKFFLLLWFWFLILIVLTALEIIYDFMFVMLPFFRKHLFMKRYGSFLYDSEDRRSSSLPELFLLDLIGHNTDKFAFAALLRKLNKDDWTASPSENQSIV